MGSADTSPRVMGIVNVTPDSFSDGGLFLESAAAVAHGLSLAAEGADILDIGGESTRPGADAVDAQAEIERVGPVVEGLAAGSEIDAVDRHVQVHGGGGGARRRRLDRQRRHRLSRRSRRWPRFAPSATAA